MSGRRRLPDRRPASVQTLQWAGKPLSIGVGYDDAGLAKEAFAYTTKVGSDLEALLQDACVLFSMLLQHGESAQSVADSLGREGIDPLAPAASVLGLLAATVAKTEEDEGPAVRMALAAEAGRKGVQ